MDDTNRDERSLALRVEESARERDAALDREEARRRGVVHTPAAIARFVAREADCALREALERPEGLAAHDLVLVDPATGPGIFLAAAIEQAGDRGAPRACVGLDVDPGAIARARSLLEPAARRARWPLHLACADSLASLAPHPELESDDCLRVVVGNPPWAARTANREAALTEALLEDFRRDATGAALGERKIGVLSDDYVRFVRWSAELVRRARRGGVLALVTNGSFLDGPVHRGMRAALARWLDEVRVVDLGGSSLVARTTGADENVFGVRPSVAITIAVRRPERPEPRRATLCIARALGTREEKLDALSRDALEWHPCATESPWRIARGRTVPAPYRAWPGLDQWMPFHREGLQTNRDDLVIALDRDALLAKLDAFARRDGRFAALKSTAHWDPEHAREIARSLLDDPATLRTSIRRIAYRPFDVRWAITHPALCHRPRPELARALDHAPLALVSVRKDRGQLPWAHFGAADALPDNCWLSTRSSCRARAFPLHDPEGAPNLAPDLARATEDAIGAPLDAPRFARWALAWLAARAYRDACDDALRDDYPRIPPPRDAGELARITAAGDAIVRAMTEPAPALSVRVHDAPPGRARIRAEDGIVERGGAIWVEGAPPAALGLVLGHDRVLARWLERPHAATASEIASALGAIDAMARAIERASREVAETGLLPA